MDYHFRRNSAPAYPARVNGASIAGTHDPALRPKSRGSACGDRRQLHWFTNTAPP